MRPSTRSGELLGLGMGRFRKVTLVIPELPAAVVARLAPDAEDVTVVAEESLSLGTGAATQGITRLTVELEGPRGTRTATVLRKRLAPLTAGKHARGAEDPRHWAYWRREAEAYDSGFLPAGPGLRAPCCYAVVENALYLEEAHGERPAVERAAQVLASWHKRWDETLDRPWLSMDQLAARVAVSELDWSEVDADTRMRQLWERRHDLLAQFRQLPRVLSHGDYSLGNLLADGSDVIALDWATVGWEPVGFDLAHLALSSGVDPTDAYIAAAPSSVTDSLLIRRGFAIAVALTGASRLHWMLTRSLGPPHWYTDFVWRHRPDVVA